MQPSETSLLRHIFQPLVSRKENIDRAARPREKYRGPRAVCLKGWVLVGMGAVAAWQLLVAAPVAHAHGGVDPGDNLWLAWNTGNPLPSLFLFAAAYLYVNGLGKWDRPSHPGESLA